MVKVSINDNTYYLSINDKISYETVDDECCLYNEETDKIIVMNVTANHIFQLIINYINNSEFGVTEQDIINHLKSTFFIDDEDLITLYDDINYIINNFIEEGIFLHKC